MMLRLVKVCTEGLEASGPDVWLLVSVTVIMGYNARSIEPSSPAFEGYNIVENASLTASEPKKSDDEPEHIVRKLLYYLTNLILYSLCY